MKPRGGEVTDRPISHSQLRRLDAAVGRFPDLLETRRWAKRLGSHPLKITDESKVATGGRNDPTGAVAVGQENIRRAVKHGEESLLDALYALEKAEVMFGAALRLADNKSPLASEQDSRKLPERPPSEAEKRRLRQAQRRRMERDEGVG